MSRLTCLSFKDVEKLKLIELDSALLKRIAYRCFSRRHIPKVR